jgi:ATP-binding cassette subfamily B protein
VVDVEAVASGAMSRRRQASRCSLRINALFGASGWVLLQLFSVLCLVTAAAMYWTQWVPITLGDVVMLTTYFTSITNALLGLVSLLPSISRGFESVRSIGEVLESPDLEQNEGKVRVGDVRGAYHFEDVSFSYPEGEAAALRGFTLEVRAGEVVALVGPSGAGKSTVLSMVIGFVRPSRGRLLLDGRDNVAYGAPGLDDRRIWSALEAANAAEFVKELHQGIDTRVGERGARLSGGQKQRLAIARAILRDPRVLILDEATSALDTASERLVQEALGRLFAGRTTFIVAHRLSTIRHAHRIVVLDHGRIQQVGSHDALIAQPGLYQTLAQTQLR